MLQKAKNKCSILLDSGAFSAWRRGAHIDLNKYIEFCKRHENELAAIVNLDVIPGENGKMDYSQAAVEKSAAQSYENLQLMKAEGLRPLALFHQGERFYWLDKMLEDGESYVGISPYSRAHQNEIIQWMDRCFSRITDREGKPLIRTHGFGVTANVLCTRYPWFSVDSTSWSVGGGYGSILVPFYGKDGKADFTKPPLTLKISARKKDQSKGFDGVSPLQQEMIRRAADDANVSLPELRNSFLGRWKFNMHYYSGMAAVCKGNRFVNRVPSLIDRPFADQGGYTPEPLKMYFATVLHTKHHNVFLNEYNVERRLLSYAFLQDLPDETLTVYIKTGLPPDADRVRKKVKHSLRIIKSEQYRVRRAYSMINRAARPDEELT